jgi:hypothetical protein
VHHEQIWKASVDYNQRQGFFPLGYGSEFCPTKSIEPLSENHPNLTRLKDMLRNGSDWQLEHMGLVGKKSGLQEAMSFGNHKG